ncbi:hypothetical protein TNCV_789221 [Trichonephila clavipes]|nr:hypothetical protein TNCV_789221 [Trichonephila clavipes]
MQIQIWCSRKTCSNINFEIFSEESEESTSVTRIILNRVYFIYRHVGSGGLEVTYPLRKPKVAGSAPARADRFPGCKNRRHGYNYGACKRSLEYQSGSGTQKN